MERQTNRERGSRDENSDRDTQSGSLYDWESNRDDGGYAYGGYPEAGFGPRETRRYGDHGRSGRERTERGHYSAERPRDYAGNDWNRTYGARRYWDDEQRYGERDERDEKDRYRSSRDRESRDREDRQSAWTYMGYADPYGWPTYIPYGAADFGRSTYDRAGYSPRGRHDRGFFERAGDEVLSWFGDEDAQRRRERDHRGRGPADYVRSDDRIREDVNDRLTEDYWLDASHIGVTVSGGEVTLDGAVDGKRAKRHAEDIADDVTGVKHVQNNLRVDSTSFAPQGS